jgi:hypothetical protein
MEAGVPHLSARFREVEATEPPGDLGNVMATLEDIESARGAADIYASAVALAYDDIVKSLRRAYKDKDVGGKNETGPFINGYSVPRILAAVSNTFGTTKNGRTRPMMKCVPAKTPTRGRPWR